MEANIDRPLSGQRRLAMVIGATSKWQADGRNTRLAHVGTVDDSDMPVEARWGVGGAIAFKFACEGYMVVITSRTAANAMPLLEAILERGGQAAVVELDLVSDQSISDAFATVRDQFGTPDVLVFNAGYLEGRTLPPEKNLFEHIPRDMFEIAQHIAVTGPFLVMKEILPGMRERGAGTILFSNNKFSMRGRRRATGESIYYPRVMLRALSQVLTEDYSEHGIHVANIIIDGGIDSPGTRALTGSKDGLLDPVGIAEAYWYLHTQDKSCWTHELQLTPFSETPSV